MSAHAIVTEIDEATLAFERSRFRDQDQYLTEKDAHVKRIRGLVRQLRRSIGLPEMLSMTTGDRFFGGKVVKVVTRNGAPVKSAPRRGRKAA